VKRLSANDSAATRVKVGQRQTTPITINQQQTNNNNTQQTKKPIPSMGFLISTPTNPKTPKSHTHIQTNTPHLLSRYYSVMAFNLTYVELACEARTA
jgi:hypothetical protein